MNLRAIVFAAALSTSEVVRSLLHRTPRVAVIRVLKRLDLPPYFYLKVDDKVFALRLED
jgi:hypothetical protein